MELHLSVFVWVLVFVAYSTALSSSALKTLGGTVSSTAAGNSSGTVATSAPIPSVTNHEPCILASSAVASFSSLSPSGTHHKSQVKERSSELPGFPFLT